MVPRARQHQPRRLSPGQKPRKARHFPHLAEHPCGGVDQRKLDVGAHIENADLERGQGFGFGKKGRDLIFVTRIERSGDPAPAACNDFLYQCRQLVAIATPHHDDEAFGRKPPGDGRADVVARTDDCGRRVASVG